MPEETKPTVTALTIARLHNLGNYEHVRYEVTVSIPEGTTSAGAVLADVTEILGDLRPSKVGVYDVTRAKARLEKPALPATEPEEERRRDALTREECQRVLDREATEQKRIARARAAFDDLGGAVRYTDAKDKWDDEDQC